MLILTWENSKLTISFKAIRIIVHGFFYTLTFKRSVNDFYLQTSQTQKHPEYTGPSLGPKMSEKNEREFTEEQLRAHEGHLNLQVQKTEAFIYFLNE